MVIPGEPGRRPRSRLPSVRRHRRACFPGSCAVCFHSVGMGTTCAGRPARNRHHRQPTPGAGQRRARRALPARREPRLQRLQPSRDRAHHFRLQRHGRSLSPALPGSAADRWHRQLITGSFFLASVRGMEVRAPGFRLLRGVAHAKAVRPANNGRLRQVWGVLRCWRRRGIPQSLCRCRRPVHPPGRLSLRTTWRN